VAFRLQVVFCTRVVYALLVVLVRSLGKRLSGQVGNLELALGIGLGATAMRSFRSQVFERWMQGEPAVLH
jgi:uncharacterized membrane protein YcaP (DUF421 family)